MCRLYGFHSNEPTKVECELVHSQNALIAQSVRGRFHNGHTDGWGIVSYANKKPKAMKQAWAAYHGEHFKEAAARIYSKTVLAHIRKATVGKPLITNTHPFVFGKWSFIHNGSIEPFDEIRDLLRNELSDEHKQAIKGSTDSEHVFHYLLSLNERRAGESMNKTIMFGVQQIIDWARQIEATAETSLNILLTNGEQVFGTRYGRSLWHIERNHSHRCEVCGAMHVHHVPDTKYKAFVVASEPITHEEWHEVPEGTVFSIDSESGFRTESL